MTRTVTARQQELLVRIVSGSDRPTSKEASSVYALRSRGLVTTISQYAYWSAAPTVAGRNLIAATQTVDTESVDVSVDPAALTGVPAGVADLMAMLESTRTPVVSSDPSPTQRSAWRRLVFAAQGSPLIPDGFSLRHRGRDRGDFIVWLEPQVAADTTVATAVVPIPERLRRPHPLVGALRAAKPRADGWIDTHRTANCAHVRVSRASHRRATLLMQAIVDEALRRGYEIVAVSNRDCPGGLGMAIDQSVWELTIHESTTRRQHQPTKDEQRRIDNGYGTWISKWDYTPSGQLSIRLGHHYDRTQLAADRRRWKLEDRLGGVFDTLEQRTLEVRRRVDEQRRQEVEAQQRWEAAVADARTKYEQQRRVDHLLANVERFSRATRIRTFTSTMRESAHADSLEDWLTFADSYANEIDPCTIGVLPAVIPEPGLEELKPFLTGVDPFRHRRW